MTLKKQSSQITLQAQQERENFQREKNNLLVMLQKVRAFFACWSCKYLHLFTWTYSADVCRRERNWHLWKENMQSCLRGRRSLTTLEPSQRWVSVTAAIYISTSRVLLTQLMTTVSVSLRRSHASFFLCDSSDFCDHGSTCNLWRKGDEAAVAKKTPPSRPTAYLTRGVSSSSRLTADPWDAHSLPRSLFFFQSWQTLKVGCAIIKLNVLKSEGICNFFKRPIELLLFLSFRARIIQTFEKQFQNNEAHSDFWTADAEISLPSLFVSRTFCPERNDPPKQEYSALQHPSSSWSTLRMTEAECFLFRATFLCPKAPAVAASSHQASASPLGIWAPAAWPRVSQSGRPSHLVLHQVYTVCEQLYTLRRYGWNRTGNSVVVHKGSCI